MEPPVRIELATHSGRVIAEEACPLTLLSPARIAFLILQEVELRPGVLREVLLRILLEELDTLRQRCIECGVFWLGYLSVVPSKANAAAKVSAPPFVV